jgi:hypothetical protein
VELTPACAKRLPIKKITQGPTADPAAARRSTEMLLCDLGYKNVVVGVSGIPFRG